MSNNKKPVSVNRHISAASIDTNASGIAESTISLGLARFPEPPSSIPSTPIGSNFDTNSPSRSTFSQNSLPAISALRRVVQPEASTTTNSAPFTNTSPSFIPQTRNHVPTPPSDFSYSQPSTSRNTASIDWHNAASNLDVDDAEERLLPTSFITSLLQQNKDLRRQRRTSHGSDAFSGISEMTYPPLMNQNQPRPSVPSLPRHSPGRALPSPPQYKSQDSRAPPSAFPQSSKLSNRMSGDSETLHSAQGHSSAARGADISRGLNSSVAGMTSATLYGNSGSSQISSTHDSDTIWSIEKGGYQNKLSTAYEADYDVPPSPAKAKDPFERRDNPSKDSVNRHSMHSTRSTSASFISRISGLSSLRRMLPWRTLKPLPPVPRIPNISVATENAHRKADEVTPLPELVNRAGILQAMLDNGQHPYDSVHHGLPNPAGMTYEEYEVEARKDGYLNSPMTGTISSTQPLTFRPSMHNQHVPPAKRPIGKKRLIIVMSFIAVVILAAIGAGIGVTLGRKKKPEFNCAANLTGAGCSLDTTCVCTSSTNCNGLAQAIINLIPVVNNQFSVNLTLASAYSNIWLMQGSPTTSDCTSQALLLDVGPTINQLTSPNRTQWARAAMLWNAVQTQDINASQTMSDFVKSRSWNTLSSSDGPVDADPSFSTTIAGFTYNYAAQTVTQPPATFVVLGQPSNEQISRVSSTAQSTLDRMYTYAQASATQQQTALKNYWVSVLQQRPNDLPTFKATLSVAPIMFPFNATSGPIRNLYATSPSSSFPPPLSCFPQLSDPLVQRISSLETSVFGLQPATSAVKFDPACYRDRPIYGILNVLHLRLPFIDSRTGTVKQAAILSKEANPRVVLYNGNLLSSVSNGTTVPAAFASTQLDPRHYGTLSFADHVILQYLLSFPNVSLTTVFVKFILDSATKVNIPPDPSSPLFQSLQSIPTLEVAVFGDIPPSDLTSTVSTFANPSGSLFFGSDDGSAMRNWTINSIQGSVIWTENATSPVVARDSSLGNNDITATWNATATALTHNITGVGLFNITNALQRTNNLSP